MKLKNIGLVMLLVLASFTVSADIMDEVSGLQKTWAKTNYAMEDDVQEESFEALMKQADKVIAEYPNDAEGFIWRGIIKSSFAGAKGGLGAMTLVKAAKSDLEQAILLDGKALAGSAFTSLGTLYFKVPGWPIGFGDNDKAKELLLKALIINPEGIDSNYFYASFLAEENHYSEAEKYLLKAQNAAPRSERALADKGRRDEINKLLSVVISKQKQKTTKSLF
ncbi:hypothetical protein N9Y67_01010 [Pseudomonadota bacterium]|nr:hypothetical protein [Pseudomonadota bacterium]